MLKYGSISILLPVTKNRCVWLYIYIYIEAFIATSTHLWGVVGGCEGLGFILRSGPSSHFQMEKGSTGWKRMEAVPNTCSAINPSVQFDLRNPAPFSRWRYFSKLRREINDATWREADVRNPRPAWSVLITTDYDA